MEGAWSYFRRKPLQRRVTVLMTIAVAVAILLSNLAGYVALRATLVQASESLAVSMAQDLVPPATASIAQSGQLSAEVRQAGGVVVEAVAQDGTVARVPGESQQLVLEPSDLAAAAAHGPTSRRTGVDTTGRPYVVVSVPLGTTGYALVVARPLQTVEEILESERVILLCVIAAGILAAAVVSAFVARSGLRPVRQLTEAVEHVTDTKDFQPIAIRYATGDLATLARAFNQLLRSVSQMRDRQSRLIADAGHELRTPLTSLTTNIDLLASDLQEDRLSPGQRGAIVTDVRAQLAELSSLVGDLVALSRDDSAGTFQPLDLRDTVNAALDRVRRRGQDRVFDVQLDEFYLVGDPDGLERMVTNLLDNAVKWSPPGSTIRVRLQGNRLRVADSGPGIPEADVPYVFDRFFRGADGPPDARNRAGPVDRGQDRRGPRRERRGRPVGRRRGRVHRPAPRRHDPRGAVDPAHPGGLTARWGEILTG